MADVDGNVPPVPTAQEPLQAIGKSSKFTVPWIQWFQQIRDKVNILNESIINLAGITGTGGLYNTGIGWVYRTITGTAGQIVVVNGDGVAGDPTISLEDTAVTPGTYGDATNVAQFTVDQQGRLTFVQDVPIAGGGVVVGDLVAGTNVSFTGSGIGRIVGAGTLTIDATGGGATYTGTAGRISITGTVINIDASYVGQASIVTVGTITTGVWNGTAITAIRGGTGQTIYVVGDILYASTTTALTRRAIGATGNVLTVVGGLPTWAAPATAGTVTSVALAMPSFITVSGSPVTGSGTLTGTLTSQTANRVFASPNGSAGAPIFRTLVVLDGATGITSYAAGDILYAANSSTLAKLGEIATGRGFLRSTAGTGGAGPSWEKIALDTDVTSILPIANGGNGTNQKITGVLALKTAAQTITTATNTLLTWPTPVYDTVGAYSAGTPTRFTVPAGYTFAQLTGCAQWTANGTGYRLLRLFKNGSVCPNGFSDRRAAASATLSTEASTASGWIPVVAGDYFEFLVNQDSGGNLDISTSGVGSWFCMEVR